MKPWQVLDSKLLVSERWLQLREDRVRLGNGHEIERFHVISAPDWASVLCVTHASEVILVRQYRHGIATPSLELPAGVIEPHEAPEEAARRELAEETGYESQDWVSIQAVSTEPARHTTRAHFFCARGAIPSLKPAPEETEVLEIVKVPLADLRRLATDGSIVHGVHVGAILVALERGLV
ncbi:MAG TPA: NUDIX hydrolase [Polyangiaceae bacterium]|nr:NUDIX hydrolase [Polyangiaceae bacterium]